MPFFGFVPSENLLNSIQDGIEKKNSNEPLYLLRDKTALLINDEIIDAILTNVVHHFPVSDKRDTAEKLAGYIKSTVAVLLKQLLSKAPNDVVRDSIAFSERSLFKDTTGRYHVGEAPDGRTQRAAAVRGYNLSQVRARKVARQDLDYFDLILAMDKSNLDNLQRMASPEQRQKLKLFMEYAKNYDDDEVPDPYYGLGHGFDLVLDMVEDASKGLVDELKSKLKEN